MSHSKPELSESKRGRPKLFLNGYGYTLKSKGKKQCTWVCDEPKCYKTLVTKDTEGQIIKSEPNHLHDPRPGKLLQAKVHAACRNGNDAEKCAEVVSAATKGYTQKELNCVGSNQSLQQVVWLARANKRKIETLKDDEQHAKEPKSLTLLLLPELKDGSEPFVAYDNGPEAGDARIIALATPKNLEFLATCELWLADGTFKVAPCLWKKGQVYTVHGNKHGNVIPAIFWILPNKTKDTYKIVWRECIKKSGISESPTLLLDFEKAAYLAARDEFMEIDIGGCFFHFKQAIMRHVGNVGLKIKYGADLDFNERIHKLGALAFLPISDVVPAYQELKLEFQPAEHSVLDYFEYTWVGHYVMHGRLKQWKPPVFPLDLWNVHSRAAEGQMKTNNAVEVFHRHHAARFHEGTHPHLEAFLDSLLKQQALTNNIINKANQGICASKPDPRNQLRTMAIKNLLALYAKDMRAKDLLSSIAALYMNEGERRE